MSLSAADLFVALQRTRANELGGDVLSLVTAFHGDPCHLALHFCLDATIRCSLCGNFACKLHRIKCVDCEAVVCSTCKRGRRGWVCYHHGMDCVGSFRCDDHMDACSCATKFTSCQKGDARCIRCKLLLCPCCKAGSVLCTRCLRQ